MNQQAFSKEYLELQTEISNKQTEWTNSLNKSTVVEKDRLQHKQIPIIAQASITVNYEQYQDWIFELADFLVEKDGNLSDDVVKLKGKLDSDTAKKWADEVLAFNQVYFNAFAEKEKIAEWLPYFLAEHCLRPFLRVVADVYQEELPNLNTKGSCPCCGEPIRLALLEGKGLKMIVCPRCEAKWNQKRLHCSFCGNEDHESLSYYNIENDKTSKLEVCSKCNSYLKIIDTRKMFKKQTAFLLDVTTIHLDFVAQENGFGITREEEEIKS